LNSLKEFEEDDNKEIVFRIEFDYKLKLISISPYLIKGEKNEVISNLILFWFENN